MKAEDIYIQQVLERLPFGEFRRQMAIELRSHIADRVERGHSVEVAIRQLGDPVALAESYLAAVPLVSAPMGRRVAAKIDDGVVIFATPAIVLLLTILTAGGLTTGEPLEPPFVIVTIWTAVLALIALSFYPLIAGVSDRADDWRSS